MADDKILHFPGGGVASPPLPPDPPDMEIRLAVVETRMSSLDGRMDKLERQMENIDQRLRGVETAVASLSAKVDALSAKTDILVSQLIGKLPSWWQMPAVIGSTIIVFGALYAGLQYLRAHELF